LWDFQWWCVGAEVAGSEAVSTGTTVGSEVGAAEGSGWAGWGAAGVKMHRMAATVAMTVETPTPSAKRISGGPTM
jgi:hypothetical protein